MATLFSPTWQRFFAQAASAAAQRPRFASLTSTTGGHPYSRFVPPSAGTGAAPPARPRPPVEQRPTPPEPPRRAKEFAWLTWQMPARVRDGAMDGLRQTLDWRAQHCEPLHPAEQPVERTRFGLLGEALWPKRVQTLCKTLREELRECVRTVEGSQPRLERNHALAMHSVRLGQLCADLEQRGLDALEEVRTGLAWLWD